METERQQTAESMDHVRASNAYEPDVHFTFHTNAGGGKRCTFYNSGSTKTQAAFRGIRGPLPGGIPEPCQAFWQLSAGNLHGELERTQTDESPSSICGTVVP